jgi:hypothetical protein
MVTEVANSKLLLVSMAQARKERMNMRPEIISPELIEEICNYIAAGYSYAQSAKLAGIAESTFFRWKNLGQFGDADPAYQLFFIEVQEASEFSEGEALQLVRSAAIRERNWKAAAWFLERRFPEKYEKRNLPKAPLNPPDEGGAALSVA